MENLGAMADSRYTGFREIRDHDILELHCNPKSMELLDCALIGVCAVIRSTMVTWNSSTVLYFRNLWKTIPHHQPNSYYALMKILNIRLTILLILSVWNIQQTPNSIAFLYIRPYTHVEQFAVIQLST